MSALVAERMRTLTRRVLRGADALHLAGFKHAQQLGLLAHGDVGDFVEEERAAFGQLEAADALGAGVGECAFDVAEELGLEGALGQRAGVDGDHGARGARRESVEGLRDDFFAGAVLAGDEHAGVGGSDAGDGGEDRLHGGRGGDHLRQIGGAEEAILGFEALGAADGVVEVDLGAQDGEQAGVVPGFLDEVGGAAAHGFDGELDVGPRGHDDDGELRLVGADLGEQVEAFAAGGGVAGVVQVEEKRVEGAALERVEHHVGRRGFFDAIAFGLEEQLEGVEDVRLIVGDEDAGREWGVGGFGGNGLGGGGTSSLLGCALQATGYVRFLLWAVRDDAGFGVVDGDVGAVKGVADGAVDIDFAFFVVAFGGVESGFERRRGRFRRSGYRRWIWRRAAVPVW